MTGTPASSGSSPKEATSPQGTSVAAAPAQTAGNAQQSDAAAQSRAGSEGSGPDAQPRGGAPQEQRPTAADASRDEGTTRPLGPSLSELQSSGAEVSESEIAKWSEMIDAGVPQYMQAHPDRFHRRIRRGIPARFRWQVWKSRLGISGQELRSEYWSLCEPQNQWSQQIEIDISRTFPDLTAFDEERQRRLFRVLNAYAAYNPDVGYCQGMNFVAGLLLIVSSMNEEESFTLLSRLMEDPVYNLSGFYKEGLPLLRRYLRCCDKLVAEAVPDLRDHFIKESVQPAVYMHQWFLTLFINCFPLSMVMVIWDVIICDGLPVILRIAVSILQVLKDSLLSMQFEDIIKFFKMMKTYDDEGGELNAFRIGQLLMKHTEHVQIPKRLLEHLAKEITEDDINGESEEVFWEADRNDGTWLQSISRMFTFGASGRRGSGSAGSTSGPPSRTSSRSQPTTA